MAPRAARPARRFEDLTPAEQEVVRHLRENIKRDCDTAQEIQEQLQNLAPQIHQHRIYIKEELRKGIRMINTLADHLDEIKKPDTYLNLLKLLNSRKGTAHLRHVRKSLRDHGLYQVLAVMESTRLTSLDLGLRYMHRRHLSYCRSG